MEHTEGAARMADRSTAEVVREAEKAVLDAVRRKRSRVDPRALVRDLTRRRGLDERAVSLAVVRLVEEGRLRMTERRYLMPAKAAERK